MTLQNFDAGEMFIIRTRKHWGTNMAAIWHNTYECHAIGAGTLSDLQTLAGAILEFEVAMHYNLVKIDAVTVSTWEPDSHPYNPASFWSQQLTNITGGRTPAGDVLHREACVWLSRNPVLGRLGKLFLRGCLVEGEVAALSGTLTLSNPSTLQTILAAAMNDSDLVNYFVGGSSTKLRLAMINQVQTDNEALITFVRDIGPFSISGAIDVKFNHKYFDRGETTGGGGTNGEGTVEYIEATALEMAVPRTPVIEEE
jgi:hypothetical protein